MKLQQQFEDQSVETRRLEDGDTSVYVADFGATGESFVDVVDDTVMAVVDGEQYEIVVAADPQAFMNNGVLTIEVHE